MRTLSAVGLAVTLSLLAAIATNAPPGRARAQAERPLAYLSFEPNDVARWDTSGSTNHDVCCNKLTSTWSANTFLIRLEGDRRYLHNWISPSISNEGGRSLGVELMAPAAAGTLTTPDPFEKQRIELELASSVYSSNALHLNLDDSRYYGFAVYIHPQSDDVLRHGLIFTQVWQRHVTKSGGGVSHQPAFALRFVDGTDYRWIAEISNDETGPDNPTTVYSSPVGLVKGVWHEFIVRIRPSAIGQGAVQVWHNGELALSISQSSGQNIGYAPLSSKVFSDFAVRVGAYHKPQPDHPTHAILMFDQAKFGLSYASVDP